MWYETLGGERGREKGIKIATEAFLKAVRWEEERGERGEGEKEEEEEGWEGVGDSKMILEMIRRNLAFWGCEEFKEKEEEEGFYVKG